SVESQPTTVSTTPATTTLADRLIGLPDGSNVPTMVGSIDAPLVERTMGTAAAVVGGQMMTMQVGTIGGAAAAVAPESRSPEQVAQIQSDAQQMYDRLQASIPSGSQLRADLIMTSTGAAFDGLVVDPGDGTIVPIPAENVIVLTGPGLGALVTSVDGEYQPVMPIAGSLMLIRDGTVGVEAHGFSPGTAGEIVLFSDPRRIATFTTDVSGVVNGQARIPSDMVIGQHTLVFATPNQRLTAGVSVRERAGQLPRTGSNSGPYVPSGLFLMVFGMMGLVGRRRWADFSARV
ncbi:MAG: hypothetical protein ACO3AT_02690, partial [Ilumatobacteraceae bacterium]